MRQECARVHNGEIGDVANYNGKRQQFEYLKCQNRKKRLFKFYSAFSKK